MFYDKRNTAALQTLCPTAHDHALAPLAECERTGLNLLITQGYRSSFQQNIDYGHGRWLPGRIVTNSKGGWSFHQYSVAFDFVPEWKGVLHWEDGACIEKIAAIFKKYGWEWGGDWVGFKDSLHLQFTLGHDINWFRAGHTI